MTSDIEPLAERSPLRQQTTRSLQGQTTDRLAEFPWWGLAIILAGIFLLYRILTNETYNSIITTLVEGMRLTAVATLSAYFFALILGLTTALAQLSKNVVIRNLAQLYVQIIRGVPILVQIFYWAIVIFPLILVPSINKAGEWLAGQGILGPDNYLAEFRVDLIVRGIVALAFSYGAFSSEIFRAGIQSIEKGQREAALALGLTWFQSFRLIILPQALRRVLPPLGNDFIAMLKESSLLSAIGVGEITQLGKKYAAASFLFPQTYNTVAFLYLSMTLVLSMGVKYMESRLKTDRKKASSQ